MYLQGFCFPLDASKLRLSMSGPDPYGPGPGPDPWCYPACLMIAIVEGPGHSDHEGLRDCA